MICLLLVKLQKNVIVLQFDLSGKHSIESIFDIARFERVFMHQYRLLMSPSELLSMLEQRFDVLFCFCFVSCFC